MWPIEVESTMSNCSKIYKEDIIDKYIDRINWKRFTEKLRYVSDFFTIERLRKYKDYLDWDKLSIDYDWRPEMVIEFKEYLNFDLLVFEFDNDTYFKVKDKINISKLGYKKIPFSDEMIYENMNILNWKDLSSNDLRCVSIDCIENFKTFWYWGYIQEDYMREIPKGLSSNKMLNWSIELIYKFKDFWNWDILSNNNSLPWSIELIDAFSEYWNWRILSSNINFTEILNRINSSQKEFEKNIKIYLNKWNVLQLINNREMYWNMSIFKLLHKSISLTPEIRHYLREDVIADILYSIWKNEIKNNIDEKTLEKILLLNFNVDD